jgi:hypothetical protein
LYDPIPSRPRLAYISAFYHRLAWSLRFCFSDHPVPPITGSPDLCHPPPYPSQIGVDFRGSNPKSSQIGVDFQRSGFNRRRFPRLFWLIASCYLLAALFQRSYPSHHLSSGLQNTLSSIKRIISYFVRLVKGNRRSSRQTRREFRKQLLRRRRVPIMGLFSRTLFSKALVKRKIRCFNQALMLF